MKVSPCTAEFFLLLLIHTSDSDSKERLSRLLGDIHLDSLYQGIVRILLLVALLHKPLWETVNIVAELLGIHYTRLDEEI